MENQTIINISAILLIISGFTTVVVLDDKGVDLEPTHYCESRELKMYCDHFSGENNDGNRCYPYSYTTKGYRDCLDSWKEIPVYQADNTYGKIIACDTENCTSEV